MPPTRTARQPLLAEAAPLAKYARQVPFVPYEYWTDPNTLCLHERSREKMRAANIYLYYSLNTNKFKVVGFSFFKGFHLFPPMQITGLMW